MIPTAASMAVTLFLAASFGFAIGFLLRGLLGRAEEDLERIERMWRR